MRRPVLAWMFAALGLLLATPACAADTVYYYSSDTLHSEVVVTDQSRNVVERTHYAPYGQVLDRDLRDGPGYTGHEEDPETNLVYMQQRYYDPDAGRFLSVDPVQADGGGGSFNRYEYADDNPYRYTDPDGRAGCSTGTHLSGQSCASLGVKVTQVSAPSPVSKINVLGQKVSVHYNQNVSSDDRSMASTSLSSAAGLLNEHKNDLSGNQKHAIAQINAVSVTASSKALLGEIGRTMRLSTGYIKSVLIPWLASIFGHEGQHLLDKGQYSGSNLWLGERSAGLTQLGIGRRIGYSQAEIDYLQGWVDIRNRDAMQQHVEQGYSQ